MNSSPMSNRCYFFLSIISARPAEEYYCERIPQAGRADSRCRFRFRAGTRRTRRTLHRFRLQRRHAHGGIPWVVSQWVARGMRSTRNLPRGTIRRNGQSGRVVEDGTVCDPAAVADTQARARLRLSDYVPAVSAAGALIESALIERTLAAGAEFITADPKHSAPGAASYQGAVYHQFDITHALEPLRPGDAEFHFRTIGSTKVVFETNGLITEIPGASGSARDRSALAVRVSQVHCEFVSILPAELYSQISHLPWYTKATIGSESGKAGK